MRLAESSCGVIELTRSPSGVTTYALGSSCDSFSVVNDRFQQIHSSVLCIFYLTKYESTALFNNMRCNSLKIRLLL